MGDWIAGLQTLQTLPDDSKTNRIRIDRGKIRDAAKFDGKWVLETNDDTISLEGAAIGQKGLMIIGRCFGSLKGTQIKIPPVYHWRPRRIDSLVRTCVLALLMSVLRNYPEISLGRKFGAPWKRYMFRTFILLPFCFFCNQFIIDFPAQLYFPWASMSSGAYIGNFIVILWKLTSKFYAVYFILFGPADHPSPLQYSLN